MESIMVTYGYTPEAIDAEMYEKQTVVKGLESQSSDYSGVRLFLIKASNSFSFQTFFCLLIVLNAITMGFEADASKQSAKDIYSTLESVYCALFLIEVIVRIAGSVSPPWQDWALCVDTMIVLIGVVDNWILNATGITGDNSEHDVDLSVITVLRVLRIVRVLRVFRAIAVFRPIRVLIASTIKAITNLVWIIVLLLVLFYCFALTFRMLLQPIEEDDSSPELKRVVQDHFRSVGVCIVTGMEVLLGGFNWSEEITAPLMDSSHTAVTSFVWLFFVAVVHVCVANMIVGVFVEQLLSIAKETDAQVDKEQLVTKMANIVDLKRVFDAIDADNDGKVSRSEFKNALMANPELSKTIGLSIKEADNIFDSVDYSSESQMQIEELIFGVIKFRGGSKSIDMMCFDYQIKQIIRQMQRSPQAFEELGNKLARFEEQISHLTRQMEHMKNVTTDKMPDFADRLEKLEEQMSSFLVGLQVPSIHRKELLYTGVATPPLSLANLRESYQLAEEMKELRKVVEAATAQRAAVPAPAPQNAALPAPTGSPQSMIAPRQGASGQTTNGQASNFQVANGQTVNGQDRQAADGPSFQNNQALSSQAGSASAGGGSATNALATTSPGAHTPPPSTGMGSLLRFGLQPARKR